MASPDPFDPVPGDDPGPAGVGSGPAEGGSAPVGDDATAALDAVSAANRAFYEAFEARDLDAMSDVWEHSDRVSCVHPGWTVLRGWGTVSASWLALFQGPQRLQFILTDERVAVAGDTAWVTVDENIIGNESGATVAALNVFVHRSGRWKLVAHHGSAVLAHP